MSSIRANVVAAKARLAQGYEEFKRLHQDGCRGAELCARIADLRDAVLLDLIREALVDLNEAGPDGLLTKIALVANGGYGRREVAPFSDVDLQVLYPLGLGTRVAPFAERLLRDVFDAGLILGHGVRTPEQTCRQAMSDPDTCTSLVQTRLLAGNKNLFQRFRRLFRRQVNRRRRLLIAQIERSRQEERLRFGDTVFLLEPDVKRSSGALRDVQFIRWIGFLRYDTADFDALARQGILIEEDLSALKAALEFLLRLRNELHFHAASAAEVLNRAEQLRIAETRGYRQVGGLLPVERFMRDYFRHTKAVSHIAARLAARAKTREILGRLSAVLFGHRVEEGIRVGPAGLTAGRRRAQAIGRDLTALIHFVDLANLYNKPVTPETWEIILRETIRLPDSIPPPEACRHFLSLLNHPARLGPLLHDLHDAGLLERFIPDFARARGLLQFNLYHKYTVDEHCLRAVDFAADLWSDPGPLGRVYRHMRQKYVLHLALLLHDLGKGHLEDHLETGVAIAISTAHRLGLNAHDTEALRFLVHKHELMNHLAFHRDTADEQLAVDLAVQVGSPDLLQMLYVMTASDLGAVGPDVWDGWKAEIITDLYHRTMQQLAGDSPATVLDELRRTRREAVRAWLGPEKDDPWYKCHIEALTPEYLNAASPRQAAADLRLLKQLAKDEVIAVGQYIAETNTCQYTIATSEQIAPGIFHKLTGALTSRGLAIRSAQIHTLADGLVLDRFWVHDPDFAGQPPPDRIQQIQQALVQSLKSPGGKPPTFRRTWNVSGRRPIKVPGVQTRVNADNSTSDSYTILDIFAHDRTGLLYAVTRTLFELGLSVARAKIGTYLDQVVDVFYVTDQNNRKIEDDRRLDEIRRRVLEVIETMAE
ncbi:MAG: [protein-PII] uridylyltransferase [Thermoguttaceae bacterium]|jgi:[protein-PII] uridylyltransferase